MQLTDEMRQHGASPVWLGYIGVDDVDLTVDRIVSAGGRVQMPPFDIPDVGRLAMVTDPHGAVFYVIRGFSNQDRNSTRLNSSHVASSYAAVSLKKIPESNTPRTRHLDTHCPPH